MKMSLTLPEICERLKQIDEITLMEKLNITSEDLVERFSDLIEDKFEIFETEVTEEEDDDEMSNR